MLNKPLKIALMSPIFPPEMYTSASMCQELAQELVKRGHDVTVFTTNPNRPQGVIYPGYERKWRQESFENGYRLIRTWSWFIGAGRSGFQRIMESLSFGVVAGLQFAFDKRFDVMLHISWPALCASLLTAAAKAKGVPSLYYIQDFLPEQAENTGMIKPGGFLSSMLMFFDRLACQHSAGILVLSDGFKDHVVTTRGTAGDKILVSPIHIDTNEIYPVDRNNYWRAKHDIDEETKIVLYSGTLGHVSGITILKDVLSLISEDEKILFICIGEGPCKADIEMLVEQYPGKIMCLPFQEKEDYVFAMGACDIALLTMDPKCGEGSVPSKMYAYMAAGRAVVSNAPEGSENRRLILSSRCGTVVSPDSPEQLAEGICKMLRDQNALTEMGRHGRSYIEEHCTPTKAVDRLESFWAGLTGNH